MSTDFLSPKGRLRLELIRIVDSDGRVVSANMQRVHEYEKFFDGLLVEDEAPKPEKAAPKK